MAGDWVKGDNSRGSRVCEVDLLTLPVENKRRVRGEPQSAPVAESALIGCAARGVDDELHFNFARAVVAVQTSIFFSLTFTLIR